MAGYTYTYDGDGNRIKKSSGKIYWYGAGTEILDESDSSGNFTNEYVFFGGKRVAMRNVSSGTIYYYEEDMLGSSRTMVQAGQTSVCYDADFYPFGGERDIVNTCTQNYKFEGKERDTETGNDDFGARYYTSRLGRWLSADWSSVPAPVPYANLTNPQTLNLYAMVSDNPETFADLDGHDCEQSSRSTNDCPKNSNTPAVVGGNDSNLAAQKSGTNAPTPQPAVVPVVVYTTKASQPWGHVAIKVGNNPAVGLEPNSKARSAAAVGHEVGSGGVTTPVAGHVEVDNSKATDKVTLYVTKDQADHMQSFISDASKQQQSYDFLYSNCATFVESTLGAGGVKAPNDMTPHGLVEDLKKLPQTAPPGGKQ